MRNGSETCCGNQPTAQDPADMLHKCAEHHSGVPMPIGVYGNNGVVYGQASGSVDAGGVLQVPIKMTGVPELNSIRGSLPIGVRPTGEIAFAVAAEQDYEHELKMFVDAMKYKLARNASRGKWENTTLQEALEKLRGEVKELEDAITRNSMVEILLEASDCANYAMIAAHIAVREEMRK